VHEYGAVSMTSDVDAYVVTSNDEKLATIQSVLGNQLSLTRVDLELPEIQSTDTAQVAKHKVIESYKRIEQPVIVDDFGLYLDGLGRFPGPLVKHLLIETGIEGLRALHHISDGSGTMVCSAAFFDGARLEVCNGKLDGTFEFELADPDADMLVSTLFVPSGYETAIGELDIPNHRIVAYEKLCDTLPNDF
jgi:XTP/dITP diphosphohydrolase